ncbi:MAG: cytochrome c oxidase subunit II [Planctomycetota bacterium]|nr:MAG: cytochrome c oxidase subunit II [Planctomycetota bacterium]
MNTEFQLFPDAASTTARPVDQLYLSLVAFSAAMSIFVAALVIYLAIKYRRNNDVDRTQRPTHASTEITWMLLSLPVLVFIFIWGAKVCFFLLRSPDGAMPITVVPKQWMWKFQHANGRREIDTLHIPVGQPVRLTMVSQDVIHSFFVPAFRIKRDVLPGRYTDVWFEATEPGQYRLYCAEYCGTNHSRMVGKIVAMTPGDFAAWLSGASGDDEPPQVAGEKLFEQLQCASCHRAGGDAPARGPSLEQIYQRPQPLASGETVVADDAYLRESILRPAAKVVAGYQPIMPTYEGQISEEGVIQLLAYIKSLGSVEPAPPAAAGTPTGEATVPQGAGRLEDQR